MTRNTHVYTSVQVSVCFVTRVSTGLSSPSPLITHLPEVWRHHYTPLSSPSPSSTSLLLLFPLLFPRPHTGSLSLRCLAPRTAVLKKTSVVSSPPSSSPCACLRVCAILVAPRSACLCRSHSTGKRKPGAPRSRRGYQRSPGSPHLRARGVSTIPFRASSPSVRHADIVPRTSEHFMPDRQNETVRTDFYRTAIREGSGKTRRRCPPGRDHAATASGMAACASCNF